jgi:hypothetical protein
MQVLDVHYDGQVASIDVREQVRRGEHPKAELLRFVQEAAAGTIIEVHMPFRAEPLVAAFRSAGMQAVVSELGPDHFRLRCVKL